MSRNYLITIGDLAELIPLLIRTPEQVGELDGRGAHSQFVLKVVEAVADHCGGIVEEVDTNGNIIILANDSLPNEDSNVWTFLKRRREMWTGEGPPAKTNKSGAKAKMPSSEVHDPEKCAKCGRKIEVREAHMTPDGFVGDCCYKPEGA